MFSRNVSNFFPSGLSFLLEVFPMQFRIKRFCLFDAYFIYLASERKVAPMKR